MSLLGIQWSLRRMWASRFKGVGSGTFSLEGKDKLQQVFQQVRVMGPQFSCGGKQIPVPPGKGWAPGACRECLEAGRRGILSVPRRPSPQRPSAQEGIPIDAGLARPASPRALAGMSWGHAVPQSSEKHSQSFI